MHSKNNVKTKKLRPPIKNKVSNTAIELPSVNRVTQECNIPIFIKIQSLISDTSYKRIFSDEQLKEVLMHIYDKDKMENLQNYQKRLTSKHFQKSNFLKTNGNKFAEKVRKGILLDTLKSSRYVKSKAPLSVQSDFSITPIKLYQHNLLSKYCILKNYVYLPQINLDCIDFLEKVQIEPFLMENTPSNSNLIQLLECVKYNLPSLSSLMTINYLKMKKTFPIVNEMATDIKLNERKSSAEMFSLMSFSNKSHETKFDNFETDPIETKISNKNEIIEESEPIVIKSCYKGYIQPRLSKENIQELIRQSLTNLLNKDKEFNHQSEIRKPKSNQRRRSTISESQHFTESGDFEFSTIEIPSSTDIAANESIVTALALNETKELIKLTEETEEITWSGNRIGKHQSNMLFSSRYEGNYGHVDGIHLKNFMFPSYSFSDKEKQTNETFTALSHMYSLKKLLEQKSVINPNQQGMLSCQTFSFSKAILGSDKDSFQSEQSNENSLNESQGSYDIKLINMFKNKLCG